MIYIILNVYSNTQIDVEQINLEVGTARETRALLHFVGFLLLVLEIEAENAKRYVEAHVVVEKHTQARREVQTALSYVGACIARLVVVIAQEPAGSAAKRQVDFVENAEPLPVVKTDVVAIEHRCRIIFVVLHHIVNVEIKIVT